MKKRKDGYYQKNIHCGYDDRGKRIRKTIYGRTLSELNEKIKQFHHNNHTNKSKISDFSEAELKEIITKAKKYDALKLFLN